MNQPGAVQIDEPCEAGEPPPAIDLDLGWAASSARAEGNPRRGSRARFIPTPSPRTSPLEQPELTVEAAVEEGALIVRLAGPLDTYTVEGLRAVVDEHCHEDLDVIVDVRKVTFMDSSGLGALVTLRNRLSDGGRAVGVVRAQTGLERIFEIAGLGSGFVFGESVEAVRGRLRSRASRR